MVRGLAAQLATRKVQVEMAGAERTGGRTERRERFGRAAAIVWKGATLVETSGARASPLSCTR
jgi:hypothetical protein